jgi:hypothetical protein
LSGQKEFVGEQVRVEAKHLREESLDAFGYALREQCGEPGRDCREETGNRDEEQDHEKRESENQSQEDRPASLARRVKRNANEYLGFFIGADWPHCWHGSRARRSEQGRAAHYAEALTWRILGSTIRAVRHELLLSKTDSVC